jgi:hypothetical protein
MKKFVQALSTITFIALTREGLLPKCLKADRAVLSPSGPWKIKEVVLKKHMSTYHISYGLVQSKQAEMSSSQFLPGRGLTIYLASNISQLLPMDWASNYFVSGS